MQSFGATGRGPGRTALFAPGLPEMRALGAGETATGAEQEIVVTLLRSVGWLSRFDLNSRTTGARPALPTPEAQCQGRQTFHLAMATGTPVADDRDLAHLAAAYRTPPRAWQLRPDTAPAEHHSTLRARGALLSALKPAEDGNGLILRLSNPGSEACRAQVSAAPGSLLIPSRLDENPADEPAVRAADQASVWEMGSHATLTLRVVPPKAGE
ncbi:hypothetical protein ACWD7Y_21100 [Streptomyces drozdowiczii]